MTRLSPLRPWSPSACNRPAIRVQDLRRAGVGEEGRGRTDGHGRWLQRQLSRGCGSDRQAAGIRQPPEIATSSTSTARLAAMSFIYALETMGLSSCAINWPTWSPRRSAMAKLLGLEPDERVIMLIAVGYADPEGLIPYSQKLALDRVRSYNRAG
ncbi:nitroreductase family protein [Mycolicibacterium tokaiense]|uniref:nitroreductase family protein n=1 Tax=Mycolicibacterium tokaiense TaxID=39695 RepID=UPI00338FC5E8